MICLLNFEAVILEIMTATRVRIAQQLQVPIGWVDVKLIRDKRFLREVRVQPEATIRAPSKSDPVTAALAEEIERNPPDIRFYKLTQEQVTQELRTLVILARNEIDIRMRGLDT